MADQNAKINDPKTNDPKTDEANRNEAKSAFAPEPLPESSPVADHGSAESLGDEHADAKAFPDIMKDVEPKTSVTASVKALVENVALEFQAKASEGAEAVHELAEKVNANAESFADAVMKNTDKTDAAAPSAAQRGLMSDPLAPGDSKTGEPHNAAAESAVRHGMDVETANKMTAPGTNA